MNRLRLTPRAALDLEEIGDYVARHDSEAAVRLIDRLIEVSRLLRDNPRIGTARDDIARDVRTFAVGRYVILLKSLEDGVEIVRYAHGARRLRGLF